MKRVFLLSCIITLFFGFVPPADAAVDYSIETVDKFRVGKEYKKKVRLRWKKVQSANFYQIKTLRKKSDETYKTIKRSRTKKNVKRKFINKLSRSREYYFKIRACKTKQLCGPWSDPVRAVTLSKDPVLKNLLVDFEPLDPETKMAGAFDFNAGYNEDKLFYEFGAEARDGSGGIKLLPTFEYRVSPSANVYAPVSGTIIGYEYQDSTADYEISIGESLNDNVLVGIDHIKNITVSQGDKVKAGDILGKPGTWSGSIGRVELDIYGIDGHVCPFNYFSKKLEDEYHTKVLQHMEDWETWKYDDTIYDEDSMIYAPGCVYNTLAEDEL